MNDPAIPRMTTMRDVLEVMLGTLSEQAQLAGANEHRAEKGKDENAMLREQLRIARERVAILEADIGRLRVAYDRVAARSLETTGVYERLHELRSAAEAVLVMLGRPFLVMRYVDDQDVITRRTTLALAVANTKPLVGDPPIPF